MFFKHPYRAKTLFYTKTTLYKNPFNRVINIDSYYMHTV